MKICYKIIKRNPSYRVSNCGEVFGPKFNQLKLVRGGYKNKYLRVNILINNRCKYFYVHRLVLEAFTSDCPTGMQACHNDGNTQNNNLSNLRWDTPKNNSLDKIKHGTSGKHSKNSMSKISDIDALYIIKNLYRSKTKDLAQKFKITTAAVSGISVGSIRFNETYLKYYILNKSVNYRRVYENRMRLR